MSYLLCCAPKGDLEPAPHIPEVLSAEAVGTVAATEVFQLMEARDKAKEQIEVDTGKVCGPLKGYPAHPFNLGNASSSFAILFIGCKRGPVKLM